MLQHVTYTNGEWLTDDGIVFDGKVPLDLEVGETFTAYGETREVIKKNDLPNGYKTIETKVVNLS